VRLESLYDEIQQLEFQSTHLREVRHVLWYPKDDADKFQSTHLREVRLEYDYDFYSAD